MKARLFWISLATAAILGLTSIAAFAQDRKVNCDVGQSLQDAINKARSSAAPLVLRVKGTCYETIRTSRDLLTIDGGNDAVIHGSVINRGARVTIRDIGITGPGAGMRSSTGRARLLNVHLYDNADEGLVVSGNGTVFFAGGSVRGNGLGGIAVNSGSLEVSDVEISDNAYGIDASMARVRLENTQVVINRGRGIGMSLNSALEVLGGAIVGNHGAGVVADNNSSLQAESVDISWNGSTAIAMRFNSNATITGGTINNNGQGGGFGTGVFVSMASSATIDGTEVYGNLTGVNASRQSFVHLRGPTVVQDNATEGVRLVHDSGAVIDDPVFIPPNGSSGLAVNCFDTESSLDNRSAGVGPSSCTGFDSP